MARLTRKTMRRYLDWVLARLDWAFRSLVRHCPSCGGELHRRFSLLDRIGLYVPIPHTIHAHHACSRCHSQFHSYRTLTDLFLELSWLGACAYLGQFKLLALVCPITFLIVAKMQAFDGADTVAAGALTGILWILALVFGGDLKYAGLVDHPLVMVPLLGVVLIGMIWIVMFLDRWTTFGLEPDEEDGGRSEWGQKGIGT